MALVPITTQEQADSNTLQIKEQDKIVIDQYFTHLATLEAYPPPSAILVNSTSRTFLSFGTTSCSDVVEQTIDDRASASNSSLRQRYNLAINAKTDTNKLIKS